MSADDWEPEGLKLESAALDAAKSDENALVIAGPGAGKTELLAQRACFLLQTGRCPEPYRILAISFKRDAAENLKNRVTLRCGAELAARFDSLTFDAFAKDLLDRFSNALPSSLRPPLGYEPLVGPGSYDRAFHERLLELSDDECELETSARMSINAMQLVRIGILGRKLPFTSWPGEVVYRAGQAVWMSMLQCRPSLLTFPMISRLAEYIVRSNPAIERALHSTYKYVFLDEFQDTTSVQFSLAKSCFLDSAAVLTAVGDSKQRIMGWAGALDGVFQRYQLDFSSGEPYILNQNHRSRAILVGIQSVFARELDPDAIDSIATGGTAEQGECNVFEYQNHYDEARHLSQLIQETIDTGVPAHEVCVLCRARPETFAKELYSELRSRGMNVFFDVNRRDTIAEPVSSFILDMLELMGGSPAPQSWENVSYLLSEIEGDTEDHQRISTMLWLHDQIEGLKAGKPDTEVSDESALITFFQTIVSIIGREQFGVMYPQYRRGGYLDEIVNRLATLAAEELAECDWGDLPNRMRGADSASIMTMHKSKGLEFHTVIFLGLEDGALWGYERNSEEETCGLFVALSRAKERCVFTFCRSRMGRYNRPEAQSRVSIGKIYELFEAAGVEVESPV